MLLRNTNYPRRRRRCGIEPPVTIIIAAMKHYILFAGIFDV